MERSATDTDLLTVGEAAALLRVGIGTIRRWTAQGKVLYVLLPGGQRRIPRGPLLASLGGNYDLEHGRAKQTQRRPEATQGKRELAPGEDE
jgi:excisionase family DNA binding protein